MAELGYTPVPSDPRWTTENVAKLRNAATESERLHEEAVATGGYDSGHADEIYATDPVEVTHETIAIQLTCAADLIETHVSTAIELEHAPGWAALVNRSLDLAGIH